jgi:hypothetical protein
MMLECLSQMPKGVGHRHAVHCSVVTSQASDAANRRF